MFTLRLKSGAVEQYVAHHNDIRTEHPDLAQALTDSGIRALRIYQDDDRLILAAEATDAEAMQRLWATPAHDRWSTLMDPLIEMTDDGVPAASFLDQLYEFDSEIR